MKPKRKQHSDSIKAAVQATQAAALGPLLPPDCVAVREPDMPLWDAIVLARPRDTWTEADLILAGQLARLYGDIIELEHQIDINGMMLGSEINPACNLLDKMSRRALAIARQLKVDTISTVGKSETLHRGSAVEREARAEHDDDDLIPRLSVL